MCDHCGCDRPLVIPVEQDVLAHDRAHAEALRKKLDDHNARLVNIIGGPGCGKTALVCRLVHLLEKERRCLVVVGDLATENDAERIRKTGAEVYAVQTGTACHLTAHQIDHALGHLSLERGSVVLVENVGNLVCPSMFPLGESLRLVCLSVTEGTDKPEKYPVSFREADAAVLTKVDLLPHVDFDLDECRRMIRDLKPGMPCVTTSARDGEGVEALARLVAGLWTSAREGGSDDRR